MFAAACDPLSSQRAIERTSVANDLFDCFPVTPAAQGIVCVVIERNVQDGAQVYIETEEAEQSPRDVSMKQHEIYDTLIAELMRIRRFIASQSNTRNVTRCA